MIHIEGQDAMSENRKLVEAVLAAAKKQNGRSALRCAEALRLAEHFGVKPHAVGRICDARNIKICACQLGCFK